MNYTIIFLLAVLIWTTAYAIYLLLGKSSESEKISLLEREKNRILESKIRLESELERKSEALGEMKNEIKSVSTERDELGGRYETVSIEKLELVSAKKHLEQWLADANERLARYDAEETRRTREFEERIARLHSAEKALEDERQRIRREDEMFQTQKLEEQTRIWNDHEQGVLSRLRETCQRPSIGFTLHDNTTLPTLFTKFKPDAVIPFLGQYVVFDAKKSKSIRTYIPEQVKSTAKKYKWLPEIYPTVFFIVPTEELQELKNLSYIEEGFSFYIISTESIEPILAGLKKISEYDTIADFDPQDRETIVNLIAGYDRHISLQNAANILFTRESITLMGSKEGLHPEIQKEIVNRKEGMRTKKLNEAELKKIAQNMDEQERQIEELLTPRVMVGKMEMDEAQKILE